MRSKITFFVLGSMLTILSYNIGNLTANPGEKVYEDDVVIKGNLAVEGVIIITNDLPGDGKLGKGSSILLQTEKEFAQILLVNHPGGDIHTSISATTGNYDEEHKCEVLLVKDGEFEVLEVK